jgi:cytoskeleton-associated protein 5
MEQVNTGVKHKNPNVRAESCRWLTRSLKVIKIPPGKAELKGYSEMLRATLDDSQADVRDSALEALGTMMKTVGERAMLPFIDGMEKTKETKMREYFDKAEVKAKATAARPAPAKPAPVPASKPAPVKKAVSIHAYNGIDFILFFYFIFWLIHNIISHHLLLLLLPQRAIIHR